jgi:hypothetical protein
MKPVTRERDFRAAEAWNPARLQPSTAVSANHRSTVTIDWPRLLD